MNACVKVELGLCPLRASYEVVLSRPVAQGNQSTLWNLAVSVASSVKLLNLNFLLEEILVNMHFCMQKRYVKLRRCITNQAEFVLHRPGGLMEV